MNRPSGAPVESQGQMRAFLATLRVHFPEVRWRETGRFSFRPPHTICLGEPQAHFELLTLHELGHYLCGHRNFRTDIGRLQMERQAWDKAQVVYQELNLASQGTLWDEDFVEAQLDTYRDWLHTKSRCPQCGQTRFQATDGVYHCPFCGEFRGES